MNLKEIRVLLELLREYGLTEIELERGGDRIRLRRDAPASLVSVPAATTSPAAAAPIESRVATRPDLVTIEAPMVGTFYRAPSPDAEPFVREGDVVKRGQVLCIIEAMKLMNEIESRVGGRIVQVLAENGQPVEYGQALFVVEP